MILYYLRLAVIFCLCIFGTSLQAQTRKAYERAGDVQLAQLNYYAAMQYYEKVLATQRKDANLWYNYAEACRGAYAYKQAVKAYEQAENLGITKVKEDFHFKYASALTQTGQYKLAHTHLKQFLAQANPQNPQYARAKQACTVFPQLDKLRRVDTTITTFRALTEVNTPYADFAPHLWLMPKDSFLIFSALKYVLAGDTLSKKQAKSQLYRQEITWQDTSWSVVSTPTPLKFPINSTQENLHLANSTWCAETQNLYITLCNPTEKNDSMQCAIYLSKWHENAWTAPQRLAAPINIKGTTSTQPFVFWNDSLQCEQLYFASNRTGGKGQLDIYAARLYPTNTTLFQLPDTVNTPGNETSPFWDTKKELLYFSSDWHAGLGGYDIFSASFKNEIIHLGTPFNSSAHDLHFYLLHNSDTARHIFFASNRPDSKTWVGEACCHDIYYAYSQSPKDTQTVTLVLVDTPSSPSIVTLDSLQKNLPIRLFFENDMPDSNSTKNYTTQTYTNTYTRYNTLESTYKKGYIHPKNAKKDTTVIGQFFEENVRGEYRRWASFLEGIEQLLIDGKSLSVSLRGFTSPRASSIYNQSLARRRIQSVYLDILAYKGGVLASYIEADKLRIIEVPLGETKAPIEVEDAYNKPYLSIFSVEASQERRVEIIAIDFINKAEK